MKFIVNNRRNMYPGTVSIADLAINTPGIDDIETVHDIVKVFRKHWKFELQAIDNYDKKIQIKFVDKTKLVFYK